MADIKFNRKITKSFTQDMERPMGAMSDMDQRDRHECYANDKQSFNATQSFNGHGCQEEKPMGSGVISNREMEMFMKL
jgi:hypothetical protein